MKINLQRFKEVVLNFVAFLMFFLSWLLAHPSLSHQGKFQKCFCGDEETLTKKTK